jgi:hypothetical protein
MNLPNFNSCCEAACIKLWGEPDKRSNKELRWNGADAYSIRTYNCQKQLWYDHGAKRGGSTLELAAFAMGWPQDRPLRGADFYAAWQGAYERGFYPDPPPDEGGGSKWPIRATYCYRDENGALLFEVVRFDTEISDERFRYRRPDGKGSWIWDLEGVRRVLYRLPELIEGVKAGKLIFDCEGENDAEAARSLGYIATTHPGGIGKWRDEYDEFFRGADVVVISDNDAHGKGQADAKVRAEHLSRVAKRVRKIMFEVKDLRAWIDAGGNREQLDAIIAQAPDYEEAAGNKPPNDPNPTSCTIDETVAVFHKWLLLRNDTPLLAILGTVAANLLPGDPVWLGVVAPGSSAKTEMLASVSHLPHIHKVGTLTLPALLSGTPTNQRAKDARGGLLHEVGDFGIIVLKDFGSILSMRPDAKAEVLGALREIYDGEWTRRVGTQGGRRLYWKGKAGLVFGCTAVIDSHHSVIGAMGERFLLSRLTPEEGQFKHALKHAGTKTTHMRQELAESVTKLFAQPRRDPQPLSDDEAEKLDKVIALVVRLRGPLERDRHSRELENIYGAEGTGRLGLTLERLLAGLDSLGVERKVAFNVVKSIAMDSVPPIRRAAYACVYKYRDVTTTDVALALGLPNTTTHRNLEDLAAYHLVERHSQGQGKPDRWTTAADATPPDDEERKPLSSNSGEQAKASSGFYPLQGMKRGATVPCDRCRQIGDVYEFADGRAADQRQYANLHKDCAEPYFAGKKPPKPRPASQKKNRPGPRPISPQRARELADWYLDEGQRRHNEGTLDTAALDTELRAILHEEVASPELVEAAFESVMQIVFPM